MPMYLGHVRFVPCIIGRGIIGVLDVVLCVRFGVGVRVDIPHPVGVVDVVANALLVVEAGGLVAVDAGW